MLGQPINNLAVVCSAFMKMIFKFIFIW